MKFLKYSLTAFLLFALIAFVPSGNNNKRQRAFENKITIHDNQYDCGNSMEYTITDSTIYIDNYAEEGDMNNSKYVPEALLDKKLSKTKMNMLADFMEHFQFDSLQSEYISGVKKPCDSLRQILIEISWGGKKKNIQIEDCYQKDIGMLFDEINMLIPATCPKKPLYNPDLLKFEYAPEQFKCRYHK